MKALINDLRQYQVRGVALVACLTLTALMLLGRAAVEIVSAKDETLLIWGLLALTLVITSARHPMSFLGTGTGISFSDALIFLGVIMSGPYHGALLGAIDMLLACRRFKVRPSLYLFNASNQALSVFLAGQAYYLITDYLITNNMIGQGQQLLRFTLPLVTMALADYVLQFAAIVSLSYLDRVGKLRDRVRDTWPWEPITYMVGATLAGIINYAFSQHGVITSALTMILVLPVFIIIYYAFKTYHDKLGEQEKHYQELTNIYDSILEMLAMAIDAKDDVTHDHIQRVKLFARRMGEMIGLSMQEIEALKAGALLHDIGKIGIPAYILNKPGKLTEHEFEQMKMHTIIGADMLSNVDFRYPVVPIVRHHHERWDGRGYPDGLKGEDIPVTARILTLVDNYDALRSERPYKRGMSADEALAYIKENAGTFFDPKLVEIFLSMVDQFEAEAASLKSSNNKRKQTSTRALTSAAPAAGFAAAPEVDRATAALNSIAETNQRVTALYEMSRTLSSILSVEDTVAILANRLTKLLPFTTCAISLFDASRSEFEIVHAVGRHAEKLLRRRQPAEAGITGYVITNQRAMYNTNPALDLGFLGQEAASEYKGVIVFPLVKNKEPLGAIALYSTEFENYGSDHIQLMDSISQPASDAVYNALTFEQAHRDALTDPVTGLSNMRALTAQFERERARSQRQGMPLSFVVISIGNLEDATGRAKGNRNYVLSTFANLIKEQVRETDILARHSDDTFIALLPDSGQVEASEVRSRIREAVDKSEPGLRVRLGSATSPGDGNGFEELLQAARMDCLAGCEALAEFTSLNLNDELAMSLVLSRSGPLS